MNTLKEEKKARILTLNNHLVSDNEKSISEVTRNLFSDAWRSYLDQTSMAAIKVKKGDIIQYGRECNCGEF